MSSIIRTITIAGLKIKCEFVDDNKIQEYFNLHEYSTNWHKYEVGVYHLSQLLRCIRYYYYCFIFDYKTDRLEELGVFLLGHILHEKIEDYREKEVGYIIKERPILDEFKVNGDLIKVVGKADLLNILEHILSDVKTTIYLPDSLSTLSDEKIEELYGKYIVQIFSYTYYLNNSYFRIDPFLFSRIILTSKKNLKTKLLTFHYDDNVGKVFYNKIRERAKYLHTCIINKNPPVAEVDSSCLKCPFINLCPEGKNYKLDNEKPINLETVEFKKKHPDKRAYIRRNGKWRKTKLFIKFLQDDKKYTNIQIEKLR